MTLSTAEFGETGEVVKLGSDPFKTGNKHFINMLRPELYKRKRQQQDKVKRNNQLSQSDLLFLQKRVRETIERKGFKQRFIEKKKAQW